MIFADMGVNSTAWGYSSYDEIIEKLIAQGIPREQIATIGEAEPDAKKQALFEKVRQGSVRVLIGSTQKMGTGTNVQKRLVALHHLDAPWKPAEVEQRDGRILRQGNENKEVAIYRYVTEGSFDAYMWQALETKARFIGQVITGDNNRHLNFSGKSAFLLRLAVLHLPPDFRFPALDASYKKINSRLVTWTGQDQTLFDEHVEGLSELECMYTDC